MDSPPPGPLPAFTYVDLSVPGNPSGVVKDDSTMGPYNAYASGRGGVCDSVWDTTRGSYWCSNASAGGWANVDKAAATAGRLNIPVGLTYDGSLADRFAKWRRPAGAIIHVAHTQGWAWHMFEVSAHDPLSRNISFGRGGSQGGRNWQCHDAEGHLSSCAGDGKALRGGDWYVDNVLEELDEPGEFFFDNRTGVLYFWPNATDAAYRRPDARSAHVPPLPVLHPRCCRVCF